MAVKVVKKWYSECILKIEPTGCSDRLHMKSGRKREIKDSCIIANIFADPTDPLPALLGEVSCTH